MVIIMNCNSGNVNNFFSYKAVELLLDSGADVEANNHDGETPLHIMARRKRLDCIIVLLSRGAQVNAQSKDGSTPLHQAAMVSVKQEFSVNRSWVELNLNLVSGLRNSLEFFLNSLNSLNVNPKL